MEALRPVLKVAYASRELEFRDFNLNYFEDGILSSAFMVGLLVASPIFATLAKSHNPFRLIGVGLLVWTSSTAGCGCSFDFWSITVCRMLVGIGEASFVSLAAPFIDDNLHLHLSTRSIGSDDSTDPTILLHISPFVCCPSLCPAALLPPPSCCRCCSSSDAVADCCCRRRRRHRPNRFCREQLFLGLCFQCFLLQKTLWFYSFSYSSRASHLCHTGTSKFCVPSLCQAKLKTTIKGEEATKIGKGNLSIFFFEVSKMGLILLPHLENRQTSPSGGFLGSVYSFYSHIW